MQIHKWGRYLGDNIAFDNALTYLSFGIRGSGKSSLLEHVGQNFLKNQCTVIDLFGSRDGEGLAWLRSPWVEHKKILLLHGNNTDVASCYDSKPIAKYSLKDIDRYDLIISSSPLYSSIDQEYQDINKVIDACYNRAVWKKPAYLLVREAANLLYSRLKVSTDQTMAKAQMAYFIREARHMGFSIGLDTQKLTSIDIDIRITIDFIFFKSLGIQGLPKELRWLYRTYNPLRLQKMRPEHFVMLTKTGSHGVGSFPYHDWHKKAGEGLVKSLGIEVEHGEELVPSVESYQVGDIQHTKIIELRLDGLSYNKIANSLGIGSTATPMNHINSHNRDIDRLGLCKRCKRAKSEYANRKIPKHP